jgi:hypothetical protein
MGRVVVGQSPDEILHLVGDFFMKKDDVHQTMRRIAARLNAEGVDYAIIGGMALSLHGYARVTEDVDLLITPAGLERIHERLVGRGYVTPFAGARKALRDTETGIKVEFITSGEYPGDGKPKPVSFPEPRSVAVDIGDLSVIALPKLIELKLASGLTAPHRLRDLADVQDLILRLELPRDLGEQLDPSVRDEFYRMWDAAAASR